MAMVTTTMLAQMKECRERGMTDKDIGERLGVTRTLIAYYLGPRGRRKGRRSDRESMLEAHRRWVAGEHASNMAPEYGMSAGALLRRIRVIDMEVCNGE